LVGYGYPQAAVYAYSLNEGESSGKPTVYYIGTISKYQAAVSEGGERLYLGTQDNHLEVVNLKLDQKYLGVAN
jgi:hypothetical protein